MASRKPSALRSPRSPSTPGGASVGSGSGGGRTPRSRLRGSSAPPSPVPVRPGTLVEPGGEVGAEELEKAAAEFEAKVGREAEGEGEEGGEGARRVLGISKVRQVLRGLGYERTLVQLTSIRHLCGLEDEEDDGDLEAWPKRAFLDAVRHCHKQGRLTEDGMKFALGFLADEAHGTLSKGHLARILGGVGNALMDPEEVDELLTDEMGIGDGGRIGPEIFVDKVLHPKEDAPPPRGMAFARKSK